jgi:hypothetical protein
MHCGADGQVLTLICTPTQPNGIHENSFQTVAGRWQTIWPEFRRSITDLVERYKQGPVDWGSIRTLHLELSNEPLAEDAEWSIGVVFSAAETMWVLPYHGLVPGEAQAIW